MGDCGFLDCLKYTAVGFAIGAVGGAVAYMLIPKKGVGPAALPPVPERPLLPAKSGVSGLRGRRRW